MDDVGGLLKFEKDGYIQRLATIPEGHDVDLGVVHVQPTIVVSGSSSLANRISSADLEYDLSWRGGVWEGTSCDPCEQLELQTEEREWTSTCSGRAALSCSCGRRQATTGKIVLASARLGESRLTLTVDATASIVYVGVPNRSGGRAPAEGCDSRK